MLSRGDVVSRGGRVGLIWAVEGYNVSLMPIDRCPERRVSDVPCEGCTFIPIPGAMVRVAVVIRTNSQNQQVIGRLPPKVMRDVSEAFARCDAERKADAKWKRDPDRHEKPVRF